jgi:small subunit ribosomal protein S6
MREYEIMFILRPDLKEEEVETELKKIRDSVEKNKGQTKELNIWQRRKLAYPINKFEDGLYLLGYFDLPEEAPAELSREWRLNTNILRFLIMRKGK